MYTNIYLYIYMYTNNIIISTCRVFFVQFIQCFVHYGANDKNCNRFPYAQLPLKILYEYRRVR